MARKTWVLDTETKGTGANIVPLEKTSAKEPASAPRRRRRVPARRPDAPQGKAVRWSSKLPEGHVRKKSTGEIGKIQAIDAKAGTATVRWLKSGAVSTVPISAVSRS
jgi:hypothetical protein